MSVSENLKLSLNMLGQKERRFFKVGSETSMSHELERRIRDRAYELWATSGYSHGHDEEHWCAAEREIVAVIHVQAKPKKKSASANMPAGAMTASRTRRGAPISN
jgi:hypothetical protein